MKANYSYARQMAKKVIKQYNLTEVPINLRKLFEGLGLEYVEINDSEDIDGGIIEIDGNPKVAVVNKAKPIARQRFTLAHELGHIFLCHKNRDVYDPEATRDQEVEDFLQGKPPKESEADAFAAELLISYEHLKKYESDINDVAKLVNIFKVSRQAMTYAIVNYWKHMRKKKKL